MDPFGEPMYYENGIHGPPFSKFQARQEAFICYGDYGYTPNYSAVSCNSQPNNTVTNSNNMPNNPNNSATNKASIGSSTSKTTMSDCVMHTSGPIGAGNLVSKVHNGGDAQSLTLSVKSQMNSGMEVSTDDISFKNRENFSKPRAKTRKLEEIESYENINTWHQAKMRKVDSFTDEMS